MTARSYKDIPDLDRAVVVRLMGGLGNLLFQYFAGRALADQLEAPLYCAATAGILHGSQLGLVGIAPDYVDLPDWMIRRSGKKRDRSVTDFTRTVLGQWPLRPVREPHFHYWPGLFDEKPGCLLSGYWQSPRYFEALNRPVYEHIQTDRILSETSEDAKQLAMAPGAVAVHIRRGDYLQKADSLKVHGIVEDAYYERARALLDALPGDKTYLVFSDDPGLARQALGHWANAVFMEGRPQEQDLVLMSLCDHHVIANSSFSWWSAMLNRKPDRKVIAPRYWFTPETLRQKYVLDLLPDDWILL